ncbi:MAG: peptide MFS transporter [Hyphomicrobiaceae bacterium]
MPNRSHPPALATLFFVEMWERFSYYGMRALLTLFMVAPIGAGGFGFATADAAVFYGNYTMAVYLLAIPGGYIADHAIGARRSVMIGGIIIATGHFTLALPTLASFYIGLILIALGTGLFKPNISVLVGSIYHRGDPRRDAGFSLFYMGINIGAFIAPLVTGFLAQSATFKSWLVTAGFDPNKSWHWGFAAAGVGMTIAVIVFARRHGEFRGPDAAPIARDGNWSRGAGVLLGSAALLSILLLSDRPEFTWFRYIVIALPLAAIAIFARAEDLDARRIAAIFVFFLAAMVFWSAFEQAGLTIALFADRLTDNQIGGWTIPSAWYQALNPLFVIVLAPAFAALWTGLGPRQPATPFKFVAGLVLLSFSFFLMVPAAHLTAAGRVSPLWLIALFFLQTLGELCLSPVGLSTMTRLAPPRFVGLMLGVWFLASAFGNKLAGILGTDFKSDDAGELGRFFAGLGALVLATGALLFFISPWLRRLMGDER